MDAIEFASGGRKRQIERRMTLHCRTCRALLPCPPEADMWAWIKSGDVLDFKKAHDGHRVGAEIETIEKD